MPLSSKCLTQSPLVKTIVKIDEYLAKIFTKCNSLLFDPPCSSLGPYYGYLIVHLC